MLSSLHKQKLKRNSNTSFFDVKTGVYTHYKPFLHKDKSVIRKIIKGLQMNRLSAVQSAILRQHLSELTHSFLNPLERYMSTLMPLKKNISPCKVCIFCTLIFLFAEVCIINHLSLVSRISECSESVTVQPGWLHRISRNNGSPFNVKRERKLGRTVSTIFQIP